MSLELVGALAQVFTAVVIAATAIAAIIQLRHMRGGNQIATMARFETLDQSPEVEASKRFIIEALDGRMTDPEFRKMLRGSALTGDARRLLPVVNLYEQMGNYVRHGYIDQVFVLDSYGGEALLFWNKLKQAMAYFRHAQGRSIGVWFEYLAALCERYIERQRYYDYPRDMPRMPLDTTLLESDLAAEPHDTPLGHGDIQNTAPR